MSAVTVAADGAAPKRRRPRHFVPSPTLLTVFRVSLWLHCAGIVFLVGSAFIIPPADGCDFLRFLPRLERVNSSIPAEPTLWSDQRDHMTNGDTVDRSMDTLPPICGAAGRATCCSRPVEAELTRLARDELERSVRSQIQQLVKLFRDQAASFRKQTQSAVTLTERQLSSMFRLIYGPYYADHSQIFSDFFASLRHFLEARRRSDDTPVGDARAIVDAFFDNVYVAEFRVLNPTLYVGEKERDCMTKMRADLQPFGALPNKVGLLLGRGLNTWRVTIAALDDASALFERIPQKLELSPACVRVVTQMRQCHLCAGESPRLRPCLGYCVNALRGCLSPLVDISPRFEHFTDSLLRLSARLKGVHNPFGFLAPLPAQISEAIMNFQENGVVFSKRIQFRCFPPELRFRVRRRAPICDNVATTSDSRNDVGIGRRPSPANAEWFELYAQSGEKADGFREELLDFVDKLQRTRLFWTSIASTLCEDGGLAAARPRARRARDGTLYAESERCWNGSAAAAYRRPVIGGGATARQNVKYNPEYAADDRRLNASDDGELFSAESRELSILTAHLDASYEDRLLTEEDARKFRTNPPISEDDEDGDWTEASGSDDLFEPDSVEFDHTLPGDSATGREDAPSGGKRYATFRHPVSNRPVVVTRYLPAVGSACQRVTVTAGPFVVATFITFWTWLRRSFVLS